MLCRMWPTGADFRWRRSAHRHWCPRRSAETNTWSPPQSWWRGCRLWRAARRIAARTTVSPVRSARRIVRCHHRPSEPRQRQRTKSTGRKPPQRSVDIVPSVLPWLYWASPEPAETSNPGANGQRMTTIALTASVRRQPRCLVFPRPEALRPRLATGLPQAGNHYNYDVRNTWTARILQLVASRRRRDSHACRAAPT
jgi:hypothetical protein